MTDKEKIKKEIERLKYIQFAPILLCEDLVTFIDSLPDEPGDKDLEKAANTYHQQIIDNNPQAEAWDFSNAFIAGAKWQKEQMIDKACEWLLNNIGHYSTNALGAEYMCNDFREAMEGEK